MPVIDTVQDPEALAFRIVSEFPATPERVWRLWEDPRQVERWWGPPGYAAIFHEHDFTVGGRSHYTMPSDRGGRNHAFWRILALDAPRTIEFENGFADERGEPDAAFARPNRFRVELEPIPAGTRMTVAATFQDAEHLAQMLGFGMNLGAATAMGQIDAILAEDAD